MRSPDATKQALTERDNHRIIEKDRFVSMNSKAIFIAINSAFVVIAGKNLVLTARRKMSSQNQLK